MNFTTHSLLIAIALVWTTSVAEEQVTGIWKITIERKVEGEVVLYCEKYVDLREAPHYMERDFAVKNGKATIEHESYCRNGSHFGRSSDHENWTDAGPISQPRSLKSHAALRKFIVLAETDTATELKENPIRHNTDEIKLYKEFYSKQLESKDPVVVTFGDGKITWTAHRGILMLYKHSSENEVYTSTAERVEKFPLYRNNPI